MPLNGSVDKCCGHRNKKHKKTAFSRCQSFAPIVSAVACLISSWGLNLPHHITNAALSSEVGGIAKRIKTSRLRRKTKLQKSKFALDKIKKHQRAHHNVGTCLWHVSMQTYSISAFETCQRHVSTLWRYRFEKFDGLFTKKIFYYQGFFAVKRRAVFILGAMC